MNRLRQGVIDSSRLGPHGLVLLLGRCADAHGRLQQRSRPGFGLRHRDVRWQTGGECAHHFPAGGQ